MVERKKGDRAVITGGEEAGLAASAELPEPDPAQLQPQSLVAWLEARARARPGEPLAETLAAFEGLAARVEDWAREPPTPAWGHQVVADHDGRLAAAELSRRWARQAVEAGARVLAERQRAAGLPIPDALLGHFSRYTEQITPWLPVLEALSETSRARLLARLQGLLLPQAQPCLAPLEVMVGGSEVLGRLIQALEEGVRLSHGVAVDPLFIPLGKLGALALEPLAARIDELTAALEQGAHPAGEGYKPRRVVIALRNALAVALAEVAVRGEAPDPRYDRHLAPTPRTLFWGNDDFPFSFFTGLRKAQALFAALPEERLRAWSAAWRESGCSAHLEERLRWVVPTRRRALLGKALGLGARVTAQAAKTGLACTQPVYLLSRGRTRKRGALGGIRARPKGLPAGRWPRGPAGPFEPVLCLDLKDIPELEARFPGARALCLLVDSSEEGFEASELVQLSEAEASRGLQGGVPLEIERVCVPPEVFESRPLAEPLDDLRRLLREAPGRALGRPFFLQQEPTPNDGQGFVLQAGGGLLQGVNLGDGGELYLYEGDAFWECL
jgi:hypothetical protein